MPKPRKRARSTEGNREAEEDTERDREIETGERPQILMVKGKEEVGQFLNILQNHK